jgi:serine/threonine protein kinase
MNESPHGAMGTACGERISPTKQLSCCPRRDDLDFGSLLGEGSFARVYHTRDLRNGQQYAVKVVEKRLVQAQGRQNVVIAEKNIHMPLDHPAIVHLHFAFQDESAL